MQFEEARSTFLDTLYSAAVGATGWRPVLETFAEIVDAPMGSINVWNPHAASTNHATTLNTSESFQRRSQEYWLAREPWAIRGFEMVAQNPVKAQKGFVFHGASEVPSATLLESAWYRDFAREYEMQDCLGLSARASEGHFISVSGIVGGRTGTEFSSDKVKWAQALRGDFGRALKLHVELSRQNARNSATAQWQSTPLPVVVLREGTLLQSNEAALFALEAGDIISHARGNKVSIIDAALASLVKSHHRNDGDQFATHIATGRSGARWMAQLVRFNQLAGSLLGSAGIDDPAVMLALTPLDGAATLRHRSLMAFSILTSTEKQIAHELLNGESVTGIAHSRRQSEETIRWHVRNMIAKTGSRNLADLTRTLSLLLPL